MGIKKIFGHCKQVLCNTGRNDQNEIKSDTTGLKKVCVKVSFFLEEKTALHAFENFEMHVIDIINKMGVSGCLEEEIYRKFLSKYPKELTYIHASSKKYRKYLEDMFTGMLLIMICEADFGMPSIRILYYKFPNADKPVLDKLVQVTGTNINSDRSFDEVTAFLREAII